MRAAVMALLRHTTDAGNIANKAGRLEPRLSVVKSCRANALAARRFFQYCGRATAADDAPLWELLQPD